MARLASVLPIIAVCIALDQLTKALAKNYLAPDGFLSFAADTLRLQYAENSGAFLGLGAALPDPWRQAIFTLSVGLFLGALLIYLLLSRTHSRLSLECLALICGGGLSNLIDRVAYDGRVIDFLNIGIGPLRTGIFNIADMAITGAAVLLMVESLRGRAPKSAFV